MELYNFLVVICSFIVITRSVHSVYTPDGGGVKIPIRENLNRNVNIAAYRRAQQLNQDEQKVEQNVEPETRPVEVHQRYSQVKMYSPPRNDDQHYSRSDYQGSASSQQLNTLLVPINRENQKTNREDRQFSESDNNELYAVGTECPPQGTGQYPYLMDCRQFLNCFKGRGYIQSCAPGTLFNPETRECDYPSKVVCATLNTHNNDGRQNPAASQFSANYQDPPSSFSGSNQYENKVECQEDASGLFEHPYDCTKFLNCASGRTYIQDCGVGTVFNPLFKVCDWPHNVNCAGKITTHEDEETRANLQVLPSTTSTTTYRPYTPSNQQQNHHHHNHHHHHQQQNQHQPWNHQHQGFHGESSNRVQQNVRYNPYGSGSSNQPTTTERPTVPESQYPTGRVDIYAQSQPQWTNQNPPWMKTNHKQFEQTPYREDNDLQQVSVPSNYDVQASSIPESNSYGWQHQRISTTTAYPENSYGWQPQQPDSRYTPTQTYDPYRNRPTPAPVRPSSSPSTGWNIYVPQQSQSNEDNIYQRPQSITTESSHIQPIYNRPNITRATTLTNQQYYANNKPSNEAQLANLGMNNDNLPISDAIQALLKPYRARTETMKETDIKNFTKTLNQKTTITGEQTGMIDETMFLENDNDSLEDDSSVEMTTMWIEPQELPTNTNPNSQFPSVPRFRPKEKSDEIEDPLTNQNPMDVPEEDNHDEQDCPFLKPNHPFGHGPQIPNTKNSQGKETFPRHHHHHHHNNQFNPFDHHHPFHHPFHNHHHTFHQTNFTNIFPFNVSINSPPVLHNHNFHRHHHHHPHHHHPHHHPTFSHPSFPRTKPDEPRFYPTTTTPTMIPTRYPMYPRFHPGTKTVIFYTPTSTTTPPTIPSRYPMYPRFYPGTTTEKTQMYPVYPTTPRYVLNTSTSTTKPTTIPSRYPTYPRFYPGTTTEKPSSPVYPSIPTTTELPPRYSTPSRDLIPPTRNSVNSNLLPPATTPISQYPPGKPSYNNDIFPPTTTPFNEIPPNVRPINTTPLPLTTTSLPDLPPYIYDPLTNTYIPAPLIPGLTTTPSAYYPIYVPPPTKPTTTKVPMRRDDNDDDVGDKPKNITTSNKPELPSTGVLPMYPTPTISTSNICGQAHSFECGNGICVHDEKVCDGKNDCGNRYDEKNCDEIIGYEVRLSSDSGNKHEGRVEVKVFGVWGYICDDKFGMRDADVLCHELGFPLGASEVRGNSFYSPNVNMTHTGTPVFLMDEVDCMGNETSLKECNFDGWGMHDCNTEEVVGVVCKIPVMTCPLNYWLCETSAECIPTSFICDGVSDCGDGSDESSNHCDAQFEVRLVGGIPNLEGRLEVKYRGIWGTVCDDDFGIVEASVVCRMLGHGGSATSVKSAFGPGVGQIWLDQLNCIGNETSIENCSHWHWGEHNCAHAEDVGIRCTAGPVLPYTPPRAVGKTGRSHQDDPAIIYNLERSSKILPDQCGQIKVPEENLRDQSYHFRVIKGTEAKKGYHPWQATIRVKGQGKSSHWCGAVLVSKYHLLTAAHCLIGFPKGAYFIRLGDHDSEVYEPSEIEIFIENLYIHEEFRKGHHMNNDIAVIVLKSPVRFTDYIQPVCMPPKNIVYQPGMNCTISGWGSIQSGKSTPSINLRSGGVPILSNALCKQPQVYGNVITDGMFCAGSLDEGIDACDGDSGGPLVCVNNGVHTLYGIISWGQHCGFANRPGVYTKVSYYSDWIQQRLNQSMISYGV